MNENVKIIPLGGMDEIGKNMTVIEFENDIIIVDCGMGFPESEQLGIDLVLPDFTFLRENADKIRGIVITHGHEDHIGAIPYFLKEFNCPIFASRLSAGLISRKLEEHNIDKKFLHTVKGGDTIKLGKFKVEFINITHSIPGAFAIALFVNKTTILFSGDFKLDMSPVFERIDLRRLTVLASKGIDVLLCDSTNAERPGFTGSETSVWSGLEEQIRKAKGRVIVASFASNVSRLQQIIEIAHQENRKVAVSGRSMESTLYVASELGYIQIPKDTLIMLKDISKYPDNEVLVLMTGSQGERNSALVRFASERHSEIRIKKSDTVILSASQVPGNEKAISAMINELSRKCKRIVYGSSLNIHVSGHACQEELKIFYSLVNPKFIIPVHGEYWRQVMNKQLAVSVGINEDNIIIAKNGDIIEVSDDSMEITGTVAHGEVLVDGLGIGDVGNVVLHDRKTISESGIVIAIITINPERDNPVIRIDILTRAFVYEKESRELISSLRDVVRTALKADGNRIRRYPEAIKSITNKKLINYIFTNMRRRPLVETVIINILQNTEE